MSDNFLPITDQIWPWTQVSCDATFKSPHSVNAEFVTLWSLTPASSCTRSVAMVSCVSGRVTLTSLDSSPTRTRKDVFLPTRRMKRKQKVTVM